jgi:hypothetical protein
MNWFLMAIYYRRIARLLKDEKLVGAATGEQRHLNCRLRNWIWDRIAPCTPHSTLGNVPANPDLSRHVTDDVTDDLAKNLGKTVFVTLSRLNTPERVEKM